MVTTRKLARDVEIDDLCGTLGYVAAVTPYCRQDLDGGTHIAEAYITIYFRSKPYSPTGKIRGVDRGTIDIEPGEYIAFTPEERP